MTERFSYSRNGVQGRVDENCLVRVTIPSVDTESGKRVAYRVRMLNLQTRQVWEVSRRFSEFLKLRTELIAYLAGATKKCPGCVNYEKVLLRFEFPRKHVFTSDSPVVVNYRRNALTAFVALLASHTFTSSPKCPTCSGFAFTGVRDFLTENLIVRDGQVANSPVADDERQSVARDTIRDSMNVKDFTDSHPAASLRPVNSDGKFTSEMRVKTNKPKPKPTAPQQDHHKHHRHHNAEKPSGSKRDVKTKKQQFVEQPLPSPPVQARDSVSSTGSSSSNPASPASLPPSPQKVKVKTSTKQLEFNEEEKEEDDDEGFSSFVLPKSTADKPKTVDASVEADKPKKKRFHFTSGSPRESMDRESTINFDDDDDEEEDGKEDEDEDINLDFMKSVSVVKN